MASPKLRCLFKTASAFQVFGKSRGGACSTTIVNAEVRVPISCHDLTTCHPLRNAARLDGGRWVESARSYHHWLPAEPKRPSSVLRAFLMALRHHAHWPQKQQHVSLPCYELHRWPFDITHIIPIPHQPQSYTPKSPTSPPPPPPHHSPTSSTQAPPHYSLPPPSAHLSDNNYTHSSKPPRPSYPTAPPPSKDSRTQVGNPGTSPRKPRTHLIDTAD